MSVLSAVIRSLIRRTTGFELVRTAHLSGLVDRASFDQRVALLQALEPGSISAQLQYSTSQLGQDLFALAQSQKKVGGFFVEFGAADGVAYSNTLLLERQFGWTGILAEPARSWHSALAVNRTCSIDHSCVWSRTGETLLFREARGAEYSTIASFVDADAHAADRGGIEYRVPTITLVDLLKKHGAPTLIDYLSIDTEGSEFEILEHFDFSRYNVRVITCEHNFTPSRDRIRDLLVGAGYERVFEQISTFDDWYVRR